ncbi:MAG: hypothetical protein EZS28_022639 [Streblomastix strix]|uniref:Uncharacterized protein n=1 Tax=Streblomastix strix TaxID=222440 RepID=A0A5J4VGZ6_9EUKA|nr:MAG: hypothetical protein EZS28_022639 [Streblomastix strix]
MANLQVEITEEQTIDVLFAEFSRIKSALQDIQTQIGRASSYQEDKRLDEEVINYEKQIENPFTDYQKLIKKALQRDKLERLRDAIVETRQKIGFLRIRIFRDGISVTIFGDRIGINENIQENNIQKLEIGHFTAGKLQGHGLIIDILNNLYIGGVRDGLEHGKGIERYANGDVYEGYFENDNYHGKGILKYTVGLALKGEFKENKFSGEAIQQHTKQTLYEMSIDKFEDALEKYSKIYQETSGNPNETDQTELADTISEIIERILRICGVIPQEKPEPEPERRPLTFHKREERRERIIEWTRLDSSSRRRSKE